MNNKTKLWIFLNQLNLVMFGVFVSLMVFHVIGPQPSLISIAVSIALACGALILYYLMTCSMLSSAFGLKEAYKIGGYMSIATLSWVIMGGVIGSVAAMSFEYFKIAAIDSEFMLSCILLFSFVHMASYARAVTIESSMQVPSV